MEYEGIIAEVVASGINGGNSIASSSTGTGAAAACAGAGAAFFLVRFLVGFFMAAAATMPMQQHNKASNRTHNQIDM
jgi:hypothetical protein